jgi:hypothetical protein
MKVIWSFEGEKDGKKIGGKIIIIAKTARKKWPFWLKFFIFLWGEQRIFCPPCDIEALLH